MIMTFDTCWCLPLKISQLLSFPIFKAAQPYTFYFCCVFVSPISTKLSVLQVFAVLFIPVQSCSIPFSPSAAFVERFIRSCFNAVFLICKCKFVAQNFKEIHVPLILKITDFILFKDDTSTCMQLHGPNSLVEKYGLMSLILMS